MFYTNYFRYICPTPSLVLKGLGWSLLTQAPAFYSQIRARIGIAYRDDGRFDWMDPGPE